jgi:hypothetical protein
MPGQMKADTVDWNQYKETFTYLKSV